MRKNQKINNFQKIDFSRQIYHDLFIWQRIREIQYSGGIWSNLSSQVVSFSHRIRLSRLNSLLVFFHEFCTVFGTFWKITINCLPILFLKTHSIIFDKVSPETADEKIGDAKFVAANKRSTTLSKMLLQLFQEVW